MNTTPDIREIKKLAASYPVIPICREIFADTVTPISLLQKIAARNSRFYLLESVEGGETWGRYSFLGYDPIMQVTCKNKEVTIHHYTSKEKNKNIETDTPYDVLRDLLKEYRSPKINGLPPFTGGFVGYFSYRMIGYAEPILSIKEGNCNDFDLMLFDTVIAYDHLTEKISLVVNMKTEHVEEAYKNACKKIEQLTEIIRETTVKKQPASSCTPSFRCNVTKEDYCLMVEQAKKYIVNGDIFQTVLSRQFTSEYSDSLFDAYRVLRTTNPSPYMVYLCTGDMEIMSTSPETLVRLKDGRLTTFPVAGSRPRGADEEEDKRLEKELLADEKELAEHNMLVDLGRNDLGKIAEFSTVEVTGYKIIHRYSKIMHICSQVEAVIKKDCDAFSAIESVLPAGTLSGAPKIRACQIIDELESVPRGVYGGALGYVDFTGNMDTCIAIRMAAKKDGIVTVQAGSGIVADSIPTLEYEESGHKAEAVIYALKKAAEVNSL